MTDERIKEDAIELAEDFTDLMGPSWPMCGGISATKKLAELSNKRFRTAERLAKIEVLEELRDKSEYKMNPEMYRFFSKRIAELKEAKR